MAAGDPCVCPGCGSLLAGAQEICIHCGRQLDREPPRMQGWLRPAAAALAVAAIAAAVVLAIGRHHGAQTVIAPPLTTGASAGTSVPATTGPSAAPATTALSATTAATTAAGAAKATTAPSATTASATAAATTAPATTAATTTATPPPAAAATAPKTPHLVSWPAHRNGFTVVLASLPDSGGLVAATQRALTAARRGLPQTGILRSDGFASLHPGYLVIFSGIYATLAEARRAAAAAQGRFPGAYPRQIIR